MRMSRGTIGIVAMAFGAANLLALTAAADEFLFGGQCGNIEWTACCDCGDNQKCNNWGRNSPAPVCPAYPGAADHVVIMSDCRISPTGAGNSGTAGVLEQTSGTFTVDGNFLVGTSAVFDGPFVWNTNEIARSGGANGQVITLNGGLSMAGAADKTLSFFGGFQMINTADAVWSGTGNWTIGMIPGGCCPSVFDNAPGATFTVENDSQILSTSFGVGVFNNAGTLLKTNSTGISQWAVNLNNTGLIHVETGELRLTRAGAIAGQWQIDPGAQVSFAGQFFTLDPSVDIQGRAVVMQSGTNPGINVTEEVTLDDLTIADDGRLGGPGPLHIAGTLTVEGGDPTTYIDILPDGRLESSGIAGFYGKLDIQGTAHLAPGASMGCFNQILTVLPEGEFQLEDGATLGQTGLVTQVIANHGTIRKLPHPGTANIANAFNHFLVNHSDGHLRVEGGTLVSTSKLDTAGELFIAAGATWQQNTWSNYRAGATFTGDGTYEINSQNNFIEADVEITIPRLAINGTIGGGQGMFGPGTMRITRSLRTTGGFIEATTTTFEPSAVVTVAGPGFTQGRNFENFGAVNVIAGGMNYFTTFNNHAGGVVDLQSDAPFGGRFGNGIFNNEGRLVKSGGVGDTNLLGTLNNAGTLELRSGRMAINTFNQTAGTTQLAGGSFYTGTLALSGGTLIGSGVVNANIANTGGVVAPGNSAGQIELAPASGTSGDFAQSGAGSLRIQVGGTTPGTGHDRLVVGRFATLGGGLNIQRINGFQPQLGDQFVILTCTNRTGQFAHVSGTNIGNGLQFQVQYNPTNVTLAVVAGGTIPGDVDGDGHVMLGDLAAVLAAFGSSDGQTGFNAAADFDGDGVVGLSDLAVLLSNFGV